MKSPQRRKMIRLLAAAPLSVVAAATISKKAFAQPGLSLIKPSDPVATALCYVEDVTASEARLKKKVAAGDAQCGRFKPGQNCLNCSLYQPEKGPAKQGGCTLFPNKLVKDNAWCNGWQEKKS